MAIGDAATCTLTRILVSSRWIQKILEELPFSDEVEVESNPDILENTSSDQVEDQSRRDFLKKTSFGQVDVGSRQDFEKKNSHDDIKVESRQDILKRLQKALKDKTYLLILDDVWNQDRPKWDNFINSLLGVTSVKGNAIVITTRNTEVASTMQSLHTYELKGLSHEDCRSIIKAKTFGKQDIPSEFEAIGRKIATRCQEEEWLSIEEKWLSPGEGDHITKILKLSFDNLSLPSLKKCFACCSIFPKGRKIESQELIEYWMAEGFLEANGSGEMECLGDKFMKVLLHNSLLQVAERDDYGNVESCVMHDLVHDLACSISVSCNNTEGGSRVRYMIHDEESRIPKEVAKYLRTLLFEGNIYGNMFADFDGLHVLIIADDECRKLPRSSVEELELKNLSSLMNLWPRLSKLRITDVSQFMAILSSEALRIDLWNSKTYPLLDFAALLSSQSAVFSISF
ncbi:disease resistance protein RGA2-like [Salvia splendens]|uniref:disease resistance protein RGA2-like n=1 Tax=Salvia splendens TaxID=180675 RepID=UPI001C257DE1|nr:disease resistance protein RGA2-like [Salvia splendens]